jgi:hypothetical protein
VVLVGQSSGGEHHVVRMVEEQRHMVELEQAEGTGHGNELNATWPVGLARRACALHEQSSGATRQG